MSLTERPVDPDLKSLLVNNEPHQYAHLIKFERPSRPDSITGLVSTSAKRYTYLTDASRNVWFDDGSTDLDGNANGQQLYIANKVLEVGPVQEQTQATAGTTNITLDGNCIGAVVEEYVTISNVSSGVYDIVWPIYVNPILEGFREGDKVVLAYDGGPTITVNIHSFRASNTIRVTVIDDAVTTGSNIYVTMSLTSEEVVSILLDKTDPEYASFINREVFIYRTYFQQGQIVGDPILIFKGIIYRTSFEDSEANVKVSWGLTSHWGDFAQVKGRITSDAFHRALDADGNPQPQSALKPIYAYDKGFVHSETSINLLSTYIVQVEKQTIKTKKGFLGIGAKVKVKKYLEPEERHTDLDFQLQAKALPVAYGVRLLEGSPVFADTLKDDSSTVYVVYALCEGEINALYDIYIDGNSLICNDKADYDARHAQTADNTVELICRGRADAGDALGPSTALTSPTSVNYYDQTEANLGIDYLDIPGVGIINLAPITNYTPPAEYAEADSVNISGVLHGDVVKLTSPQEIELELFTGKTGQKASSILVDTAAKNNFKIQTSYWDKGDTEEYWGPNHRLLDTAYILAKFKITEGETTIPQLEFIVKAKNINCYNYDYSYIHDVKSSSESESNFSLGDVVSLSHVGGTLVASTQIIDKWTFQNPDGTSNTRFRWATPPDLDLDENGHPTITKFTMTSGANTWTMTTHNHKEFSGTVDTTLSSTVSGVSDSGGHVAFTFGSNTDFLIEGDPDADSPTFSFVNASTMEPLTNSGILNTIAVSGIVTSTTLTSNYPSDTYLAALSLASGSKIASRNTIKLSSGASSSSGYYTGMIIQVVKFDSASGKSTTQEAEIIGYDGASKIATIDSIWSYVPESGHTVYIYPKYADARCSINPAIQLLDYVTSTLYGRGLSIDKDINLPSWMETARYCDDRSDVTVKMTTDPSSCAVGDIYKYPSTGAIKFQGTVASKSGNYVTFTDVIGKLTNKWKSWINWSVGDLVYNDNVLYEITTGGIAGTTTVLDTNSDVASAALTKVSGAGPSALTVDASLGNPIRALRDNKEVSGYSLYDSDGIDYWRLSGWDGYAQRYATRFQTNLVLDTSSPLFDNTNAFLDHFGGIMRYTSGQYFLDVERQEPAIVDGDIRNITTDDIIGRIQLADEGVRSAYNSLTAAFPDPGNKFEARNISFFNSDYLKVDRNVPKKGNLSLPGVTNYYNTRMIADTFLNKSRFGLTINCTVRHHGILMLAGTVIELTYDRYKWNNKPFRIDTITYQPDGLADIVAKEYDDSFYSLTRITRATTSGATGATRRIVSVAPPTNLRVTSADTLDELYNGVELIWDNDPAATSANVVTEIYGSRSPELFLVIDEIAGGSIITTVELDHGLIPGMVLYPMSPYLDEITTDTVYFVRETHINNPALGDNQFTLSLDRKNLIDPELLPELLVLTAETDPSLIFRTGPLLATVQVPGNSFIDLLANEDTGRVEKYYWIRHKVTQ